MHDMNRCVTRILVDRLPHAGNITRRSQRRDLTTQTGHTRRGAHLIGASQRLLRLHNVVTAGLNETINPIVLVHRTQILNVLLVRTQQQRRHRRVTVRPHIRLELQRQIPVVSLKLRQRVLVAHAGEDRVALLLHPLRSIRNSVVKALHEVRDRARVSGLPERLRRGQVRQATGDTVVPLNLDTLGRVHDTVHERVDTLRPVREVPGTGGDGGHVGRLDGVPCGAGKTGSLAADDQRVRERREREVERARRPLRGTRVEVLGALLIPRRVINQPVRVVVRRVLGGPLNRQPQGLPRGSLRLRRVRPRIAAHLGGHVRQDRRRRDGVQERPADVPARHILVDRPGVRRRQLPDLLHRVVQRSQRRTGDVRVNPR